MNNKDIFTRLLKYKLYTLDEVIEFAKEHNIKVDESGYDITPFCKSLFERDNDFRGKTLEQGFFYIQDEEDASHLGGPFFHHFGFLKLYLANDIEKLMTIEESMRDNFRWKMKHFAQFKHISDEQITLDQHLVTPTKEKPYTIYICGNDDFSWTRTFKDIDDAKRAIWDLYIRCSDMKFGCFKDALNDGRFVFTN